MRTTLFGIVLVAGALGVAGCSSNNGSPSSPDGGGGKSGTGGGSGNCTGGPETAATPDNHCTEPDGGAIIQATGVCQTETAASGDAGSAGAVSDYGATLKGSEGDDDDCKYHVKFSVDPICVKEGVTFHLTVTSRSTGKAVTGANPSIEAETVDNKDIAVGISTEKGNGLYDIGPVKFGSSGRWVVRFHMFETCSDAPEDSPHGHAAFFVDVP